MNLELPSDDSDDFIDSPENEWKTVSKKKKSAANKKKKQKQKKKNEKKQ